MSKKPEPQMTKEQTEAVAKQLAEFFFDYWKARNNPTQTKRARDSKAIALASGLPRSFPDVSRAMA